MFGFIGNNETINVPASNLSADDILGYVNSVVQTGQQAYRDYLFHDLMTRKKMNKPVPMHKTYVIQQGIPTGAALGVTVGALVVGAALFYFLFRKRRGPTVWPAATPRIIDVSPVKFLPAPGN